MSQTPKFKVIDESGTTQHIGPRSSCETYLANVRSLFGAYGFRIVPMGT